MITFFSPLEQFIVLPVVTLSSTFFFTINNLLITFLTLAFFFSILIISLLKKNTNNLFLIPNRWQLFFEILFLNISSVIQSNIQSDQNHKFFPIVGSTFLFVLTLNVFGLIPYSFTITSELIITLFLSLLIFIGIQIIAIRIHKLKFFSLFLPSGISVQLGLLLFPIEFISFFFKPISLSIRLFVNMMAGHTLLKVIAGFTWLIMGVSGIFSIFHYVPVIILVVLFFIEFVIALIQAFVFVILICIYINDVYNLH
jgi:ATP synthase subunit 6